MPFDPSDEEEGARRRAEIVVRACDELLGEIRAHGGPDGQWKIEVLESLRRSAFGGVRRGRLRGLCGRTAGQGSSPNSWSQHAGK